MNCQFSNLNLFAQLGFSGSFSDNLGKLPAWKMKVNQNIAKTRNKHFSAEL